MGDIILYSVIIILLMLLFISCNALCARTDAIRELEEEYWECAYALAVAHEMLVRANNTPPSSDTRWTLIADALGYEGVK